MKINKLFNWIKKKLIAPKEPTSPKEPIGEPSVDDSFETLITKVIIAGHRHRVANGLPLSEFDRNLQKEISCHPHLLALPESERQRLTSGDFLVWDSGSISIPERKKEIKLSGAGVISE